nr:hypothetical protein Iba_chr01bCG9450 [Ipomoea batatas]GMC76521.1 hypothetical protein Iba_scaffold820479CG0010 [Ipomoea batatas]GME14097.1 hypothetical protein Iba_scaffold14936CG0060 [Ipomoea batatas]
MGSEECTSLVQGIHVMVVQYFGRTSYLPFCTKKA